MFTSTCPPLARLPGPRDLSVEIDPSFLFLGLIFIALAPTVHSVVVFALIAVGILLHELGHAWGAWVQGGTARRVVLWGGGGACDYALDAPEQDRLFAVAMGPIVNLGLWAICSLASGWLASMPHASSYLDIFATINLAVFGLNMVPVQSQDGGKLLLAGLQRVMSTAQAARIAGGIGLVCALIWIPAVVVAFGAWGFLLLFVPSVPAHWRMAFGKTAVAA